MLRSSSPPPHLVTSATSGIAPQDPSLDKSRLYFAATVTRKDASDIASICSSTSGKKVSMFDAACMADTRIGVTSSNTSQSLFLSENPTQILLPLDSKIASWTDSGQALLHTGARHIIATNNVNVSQSTKIGTTLVGEARPLLSQLMGDDETVDVACCFNDVERDLAHLGDKRKVVSTDGQAVAHSFQDTHQVDVYTPEEAEGVLQTANTAACETRGRRRFSLADNLTKPFIREPVGFGDSGFNFAGSVLEQRPFTLEATEALLRAGIEQELTAESFSIFLSPETPPLTMSRFAPSVASAASTAVNSLLGYAYDGISVATGAKVHLSSSKHTSVGPQMARPTPFSETTTAKTRQSSLFPHSSV